MRHLQRDIHCRQPNGRATSIISVVIANSAAGKVASITWGAREFDLERPTRIVERRVTAFAGVRM